MGILADTKSCELHMRRGCRERFLRHRGLSTPTCIMARAWCTCHDACRDRQLAVSFEVGGGENLTGIPSACATSNIAYKVRGPLAQFPEHTIFMWHFYSLSHRWSFWYQRVDELENLDENVIPWHKVFFIYNVLHKTSMYIPNIPEDGGERYRCQYSCWIGGAQSVVLTVQKSFLFSKYESVFVLNHSIHIASHWTLSHDDYLSLISNETLTIVQLLSIMAQLYRRNNGITKLVFNYAFKQQVPRIASYYISHRKNSNLNWIWIRISLVRQMLKNRYFIENWKIGFKINGGLVN